jgi:hypothetical protein
MNNQRIASCLKAFDYKLNRPIGARDRRDGEAVGRGRQGTGPPADEDRAVDVLPSAARQQDVGANQSKSATHLRLKK